MDPSKSLNTTLLYADKSSCSDAAEKVKTMAAVKVHQLTISHEQHSHQLLLYLDHEGLRNLWRVLFSLENSNSSLHSGLLGVVLDSGVTVWCQSGGNGRLEGGGSSSKVTAMEASSGTLCLSVFARYACVCVCVCVCEREMGVRGMRKKRVRGRGKWGEREKEGGKGSRKTRMRGRGVCMHVHVDVYNCTMRCTHK